MNKFVQSSEDPIESAYIVKLISIVFGWPKVFGQDFRPLDP